MKEWSRETAIEVLEALGADINAFDDAEKEDVAKAFADLFTIVLVETQDATGLDPNDTDRFLDGISGGQYLKDQI